MVKVVSSNNLGLFYEAARTPNSLPLPTSVVVYNLTNFESFASSVCVMKDPILSSVRPSTYYMQERVSVLGFDTTLVLYTKPLFVQSTREGDRRGSNPRPSEPQSADTRFQALPYVAE